MAAPPYSQPVAEPSVVGLPVGEEVHILAGSARKYVDHAGKLWNPDTYFSGGSAVQSPVQHIWRTQDPIIYRSSRLGDFTLIFGVLIPSIAQQEHQVISLERTACFGSCPVYSLRIDSSGTISYQGR